MKTIDLSKAVLEISSVNINNNAGMPGPGNAGAKPSLQINGQVKIGDKVIAGYGNNLALTDAEYDSTTLSGLEDLAVIKVKAEIGLK